MLVFMPEEFHLLKHKNEMKIENFHLISLLVRLSSHHFSNSINPQENCYFLSDTIGPLAGRSSNY